MPSALPATTSSDQSGVDAGTSKAFGALQEEHELFRRRLAEIAKVIGCDTFDRVVHDVRNVVNERNLLRRVAEMEGHD